MTAAESTAWLTDPEPADWPFFSLLVLMSFFWPDICRIFKKLVLFLSPEVLSCSVATSPWPFLLLFMDSVTLGSLHASWTRQRMKKRMIERWYLHQELLAAQRGPFPSMTSPRSESRLSLCEENVHVYSIGAWKANSEKLALFVPQPYLCCTGTALEVQSNVHMCCLSTSHTPLVLSPAQNQII